MISILDEAKLRLQKDFISPSHEWDYLESLIKKSESERLLLLQWVFEKSPAYWDTRARAGMILFQENEIETWQIIGKLVTSADPDDNGTALTIFERTGDPRGLELAQDWLNDGVHLATQVEAINFLKNIYPDRVWSRVQALSNHEDPNYRKTAKKLADELKAS
ncbi:MAG: hypothetical protein JNM55_05000 [Anaerolineales bacterium]|nr:hypothetical protein [Anaerolineales bacterium]